MISVGCHNVNELIDFNLSIAICVKLSHKIDKFLFGDAHSLLNDASVKLTDGKIT
jgi:hypothetical protein